MVVFGCFFFLFETNVFTGKNIYIAETENKIINDSPFDTMAQRLTATLRVMGLDPTWKKNVCIA